MTHTIAINTRCGATLLTISNDYADGKELQ